MVPITTETVAAIIPRYVVVAPHMAGTYWQSFGFRAVDRITRLTACSGSRDDAETYCTAMLERQQSGDL